MTDIGTFFGAKPFPNPATSVVLEHSICEKSSTKKKQNIPWVEKYRPRTIEDIGHQDEIVTLLRTCIEKGNGLPNLLFYGPPGSGKTSAILAAARQLFGDDLWRKRVLELNASDERGIQVVRDKVKRFSQLTASSVRTDGSPCPGFKLIILDECDSMTEAAQAALRRTMEKETRTTRFCLICNYISRIIDPITSRCCKFRFKPLPPDVQKVHLTRIVDSESVSISDGALDVVITVSGGDLRKAITLLQSAHRLFGAENVAKDDILEISGEIPNDLVEDLVISCYSNSYHRVSDNIKAIIADGYSAMKVVNQLQMLVVGKDDINDNQLAAILEHMAVVESCLIGGADEYLQCMSLATVIMEQLCKHG